MSYSTGISNVTELGFPIILNMNVLILFQIFLKKPQSSLSDAVTMWVPWEIHVYEKEEQKNMIRKEDQKKKKRRQIGMRKEVR